MSKNQFLEMHKFKQKEKEYTALNDQKKQFQNLYDQMLIENKHLKTKLELADGVSITYDKNISAH